VSTGGVLFDRFVVTTCSDNAKRILDWAYTTFRDSGIAKTKQSLQCQSHGTDALLYWSRHRIFSRVNQVCQGNCTTTHSTRPSFMATPGRISIPRRNLGTIDEPPHDEPSHSSQEVIDGNIRWETASFLHLILLHAETACAPSSIFTAYHTIERIAWLLQTNCNAKNQSSLMRVVHLHQENFRLDAG
jgi:hypothetical protein